MQKIFCPECGTPIENNSTFCPECGKRVDAVSKEITGSQADSKAENKPRYKKASGAFWNNLFAGMMKIMLVPWILLFLFGLFTGGKFAIVFALIAIAGFIITLFAISGGMVFVAMAKNVEKITNQFLIVQRLQEEQLAALNDIIRNNSKGE